jgi:hypothetical protein
MMRPCVTFPGAVESGTRWLGVTDTVAVCAKDPTYIHGRSFTDAVLRWGPI